MWKGKERATQADSDYFTDLNPVITYRHLHSHNLGLKDPLRVIALCDSDAFYASCEQVRLGIDPSRPLVVRQWDSLIAVNYPARKYGISRMDKAKDALERCPDLVVQHVATYREGEAEPGYWENPDTLTHKVSLDYYRRESWKIYHMFKEGVPTAEIEKASIDEAFLDFTRSVRDEILRRYPYLAEVPRDAPKGKDSPLPPPPPISWKGLGTVIPVNPPPPPPPKPEEDTAPHANTNWIPDAAQQPADIVPDPAPPTDHEDSSSLEEDDGLTTWHDVALSIAAELMGKIRDDIHAKLGYTMTAGIARNKFLAKLTASYKKPNNQSILRNAAIPNYLRPLPFQKIRFLGGKLGVALAQEYDVKTVGDLLPVSLDEMQSKFGEESIWVWEIMRGIDRTEVKEKPPVTKSMAAAKNLPKPVTKASEGHHWVRVLAAELALRLREARESIPALWPKSLVLHVKQGYETSRSKQAPFPFVREITVDLISAAGDKLWKELVGTDATRTGPLKITHVSLSFSGIGSMETGQKRIEGFFGESNADDRVPVGGINKPASKSGLKRKRAPSESGYIVDDGSGSNNAGRNTEMADPPDTTQAGRDDWSFVCPRCGERISATPLSQQESDVTGTLAGSGNGGDHHADAAVSQAAAEEEAREQLARLRGEHDDFHFAQDLAAQGDPNEAGDGQFDRGRRVAIRPGDVISSGDAGSSSSNRTGDHKRKKTTKAKKKKDADLGIARFFTQSHK